MKAALEQLKTRFPEAVLSTSTNEGGDDFVVVQAAAIREVARHCKESPELDLRLLLSICAVDRLLLPESEPRFELVYSLRQGRAPWKKLHLKTRVSEQQPELDSVQPVWRGADWWERYVFDFYGIRFRGHPDLRRVLLYDGFEGHPLRKDYPLRGRQPLIENRAVEEAVRGPGAAPPAR
jgi:NADH-quinone oxidoreductase subunit C